MSIQYYCVVSTDDYYVIAENNFSSINVVITAATDNTNK